METPTFRYFNRNLPAGTYSVGLYGVDGWRWIRLETRWSSLGLVRRQGGRRWAASCRNCLALNTVAPVGGREQAAMLLWQHWTTAHARAVQPALTPQHTHGEEPFGHDQLLAHLLAPADQDGHGRRSLSAYESPTIAELHEGSAARRRQPDRQQPFAELAAEAVAVIHLELHRPAGQPDIQDAARVNA